MNSDKFKLIVNKIADLARESVKYKRLNSTNFSQLTVSEANKLIKNARKVQADQDMFLKNELYHLIGMSDLTDKQLLCIVKLSKIISSSRSYVKPIAGLTELNPVIPDTSKYKCQFLGVKLNALN